MHKKIILITKTLIFTLPMTQAVRAEFVTQQLRVTIQAAALQTDEWVSVTRLKNAPPQPYVFLLHGRAASSDERKRMGRAQYPNNADWFARLGFTVITPTHIGYGDTGGPDLEFTGNCDQKNYRAAFATESIQLRAILNELSLQKLVDVHKGWVFGESFGGLIALSLTTNPLPGQLLSINMSGGDGGDSVIHPDAPCQPERLSETLQKWGGNSTLPSLWLYSANDRLFGPVWPRRWFEAFKSRGPETQFIELPADKNNGHFIFNRNPLAWQNKILTYLKKHGFNCEVQVYLSHGSESVYREGVNPCAKAQKLNLP